MRQILVVILLVVGSVTSQATDFQIYLKAAEDKSMSMKARWNALVKAAELATPQQLEQVKRFAGHNEWYMRNAALVALKKANQQEARHEARRLLKDKALVVRSAAVDILAEDLYGADDRRLLMEELNQEYNFNKKSSLWIRQQIVEKLSATATVADRQFFAKALFDADKKIAELSAKTLEKIDGNPTKNRSLKQWQNLVKENNWL